ncbi:MAG: glycosyltransferase [Planctomycetes bacterium]|nr:glycosyltransferase [Planctomycetota bacterium]
MKLGVLIPCRNEAAVIERKLANLAHCEGAAAARVVVVDDGSEDDTAERARAAGARLALELRVVPNRERPGKPGALRSGLAELAGCELLVLTDADVELDVRALTELERAFEREPALAMACGAQHFTNGSTRYDRWTARVRRLESRFGALFSVHGQLLAWRTGLGLVPTLGMAADDLDLMLQARRKGRVRLVASARFLEEKCAPGVLADEQALRRARAYVQLVRARHAPLSGLLGSLQWLFYRRVPLLVPALPFARRSRTVRLIARAIELEDRSSLPERWDMARS